MADLDKTDKDMLNIIQQNFPVSREPYKDLAELLKTTEEDILGRLARLVENGVVRRLGPVLDYKKLGYSATLCAMQVPPDQVSKASEIVNSYPGVTHNYLRDHRYNMWFTLLARSEQELNIIFEEIKSLTGIKDAISLPSVKTFKINVNFNME